jgi:hypothetical protein
VTLPQAIFGYASGVAGITALLGSGTACKLYDQRAEEGAGFPHVVFRVENERQEQVFAASQLFWADLVFEAIGLTPQSARAVADQIEAAFVRYSGLMGGTGGVVVQCIFHDSRDVDQDDDYYVVALRYRVWWEADGASPVPPDAFVRATLPVREDLTGTKNGTNVTFTLGAIPDIVNIYWNGQMLREGTGYTRSGLTITMVDAPQSGDILEAMRW